MVDNMRLMAFYGKHGVNCGVRYTRKISRSFIMEYVKRIRRALGKAFEKLSLPPDPARVLVSELAGNEAHYTLKASIEWVHVNELSERHPRARKVA
jgi:hypothetical protein